MIKYITNMEKIIDICVYNIDNGKFHFIEDKDLKIKTDLGFFIRVEEDIYGIVASNRGAIFFKNEMRFYLEELNYKFKFNNVDDKRGNFIFIIDNKRIFDLIYTKTLYVDFFMGTTEEENDFFQWLCNFHNHHGKRKNFEEEYSDDEIVDYNKIIDASKRTISDADIDKLLSGFREWLEKNWDNLDI